MKFNVGDPVLAIDNIGPVREWTTGIVSELPSHSFGNYRVRFADGCNLYIKDSNSIKPLYGDGGKKVVITTEGKTTLARLYEGGKVVRSAEAKCSPSDAFSFQTGAELAFKRLFETAKPGPTNKYEAMSDEELKDAACDRADLCISVNGKRFHECPLFSKSAFGSCTRYLRDHPELRPVLIQYCLDEDAAQEKPEPPKVDKPKYSKGDKVKILRDRTECGYYHAYAKGEIATFLYEVDDTKAELSGRCSNTGEPCMQTVHYDDFVPYTEPKEEPKPEPVKLYCAKSLVWWLTNGKVYESVNGHVVVDDGCEHVDIIMRTRGYLYPLVKRPAKVGEWVYCTVDFGGFTKAGTIYKVVSVTDSGVVEFHDPAEFWKCTNRLTTSAYLVLDGYQPEEKKPKFYNGKVVCVDDGGIRMKGAWTVGKVYTFKDGFAYQDNGVKVPCFESPITSVDDLNAKCAVRSSIRFVEYKGEA